MNRANAIIIAICTRTKTSNVLTQVTLLCNSYNYLEITARLLPYLEGFRTSFLLGGDKKNGIAVSDHQRANPTPMLFTPAHKYFLIISRGGGR